MTTYQSILFETSGSVATLTLNRPEALNALTFEMMEEVRQAMERVQADRDIRALIITGAGRGFCSGQDLRSRAAPGADLVRLYTDSFYRPMALIRGCRVPVITAINGVVAGGGFGLALAGDIAIAARSAKFIQIFSRIGLVPDLGSTWLLPRAIGRARALQMMLTNEPVSAQTAAEWGMIAQCLDDQDLLPAANALAARLARGPTLALMQTRMLLDQAESSTLEAQFASEMEVQQSIRDTHDAREGVAAFIAKREAQFRGD